MNTNNSGLQISKKRACRFSSLFSFLWGGRGRPQGRGGASQVEAFISITPVIPIFLSSRQSSSCYLSFDQVILKTFFEIITIETAMTKYPRPMCVRLVCSRTIRPLYFSSVERCVPDRCVPIPWSEYRWLIITDTRRNLGFLRCLISSTWRI
jgi:hypothetical protein